MREPTYFILAALHEGPVHGYGIIKRVETMTDGRLRLAAGTLYGALDRLVEQGLVTAGAQYSEGGRPRRDYEITPTGATAVVNEAQRLAQAAKAVRVPRGGLATEFAR